MNTFTVNVNLQVQVQAFDVADALEAVEDVFGPGETAGLDVTGFEVVDCSTKN